MMEVQVRWEPQANIYLIEDKQGSPIWKKYITKHIKDWDVVVIPLYAIQKNTTWKKYKLVVLTGEEDSNEWEVYLRPY